MFKEKIDQTNAMPEELTQELTEEQLENVNGGMSLVGPVIFTTIFYKTYYMIKNRRK